MINYIPRIFKEELRLLGKVETTNDTVMLMVSTLDTNFPVVYLILIDRVTRHILDVQQSQVLWQSLKLKEHSRYKLYSSVMAGMVECYDKSARTSGDSLKVKLYKETKGIPLHFTRLSLLQELLRFQYIRDLIGGYTTGQRRYSVNNSSHIKRVISDYHAEVAMTFGSLLPIPKDIRENPLHDEAVGRVLELFMQNCAKLDMLIDNKFDINMEQSTKKSIYTFAEDKYFKQIIHHVMNPFISVKL